MIPLPLPWRQAETVADHSAVVVPLEEAHLHSHTYRLRSPSPSGPEGQLDANAFDDDDDGIDKDGDEGDTTMLMTSSAPPEYSIEGLRKEVRRGGKGERWTAYESTCRASTSLHDPCFLVCVWFVQRELTVHGSEVSAHQQGDPGHWNGPL